jgi:hypothetical protein
MAGEAKRAATPITDKITLRFAFIVQFPSEKLRAFPSRQCRALHDHNCDRDPESFSDAEKFTAAVQASHAQNTPLIRNTVWVGTIEFSLYVNCLILKAARICDFSAIQRHRPVRIGRQRLVGQRSASAKAASGTRS